MNTYILIFWLSAYNHGFSTTAEFISEKECKSAVTSLKREFSEQYERKYAHAICVKK